MSEFDYKQQIKKFLEDKNNHSLLIYGGWGVGKTYLWKEIENEINPKIIQKKDLWKKFKSNANFFNHLIILISIIKQCVGITLMSIIKYFNLCSYIENPNKQVKNIVYVSLFGKEHYKEVLEEITLKAYKHNKILYFIRNITFWKLSIGAFLQLFIEKNFENIIVCLDDLERKSDKLDIKDILGLVNKLKEEKCKVVLIGDIDSLRQQQDIFKEYREKSIDLEICVDMKESVMGSFIKEKYPHIYKESILEQIYKIRNLRKINKILEIFDFLNCIFSEQASKDNMPQELYQYILHRIISKIDKQCFCNDETCKFYHMNNHIFSAVIDSAIEGYIQNATYFLCDNAKEELCVILKEHDLFSLLCRAKNILGKAICGDALKEKDNFVCILNELEKKHRIADFIFHFGYINFIALDRYFNFPEISCVKEARVSCLQLAISRNENYILKNNYCNIISDSHLLNELEKNYDSIPKFNAVLYKIHSYADFIQNLEIIEKIEKNNCTRDAQIEIDNPIILTYLKIYFNSNHNLHIRSIENKDLYPVLYDKYCETKYKNLVTNSNAIHIEIP
ncbi:P-loop NTPase fold protein [Campylobacter lari]|nr:P-loop NTPase fold protein [Campylobacter lari]